MDNFIKKIGIYLSPDELINYDNGNISIHNYKIGGLLILLTWFGLMFLSIFVPFCPVVAIMALYYTLICSDVVMNSEEETGAYFGTLILITLVEVF